jgi:hypothetical protein
MVWVLQQPHPFGDEGPGEELSRVLVFRRRRAAGNLGDVGGEFGLLESALEDVFVGAGDFAPGFEGHGRFSCTVQMM